MTVADVTVLLCDKDGCPVQINCGIQRTYLDARQWARKVGWTSIRILNGLGMADYCPDHGPA